MLKGGVVVFVSRNEGVMFFVTSLSVSGSAMSDASANDSIMKRALICRLRDWAKKQPNKATGFSSVLRRRLLSVIAMPTEARVLR